MARIVALMGSPRRGGNSEILLDAFLAQRHEGDPCVKLIPVEMDLGFCRGCRFCERMGHCVLHDEMETVYRVLLEADKVVVSAPVFFYGFPAHFKALIDRTQVLWARRYLFKEPMKPKEGFLLSVGATRGEKLFEGVTPPRSTFLMPLDVITGEVFSSEVSTPRVPLGSVPRVSVRWKKRENRFFSHRSSLISGCSFCIV
jgi:multimeric flavodoxin WrbA